MKVAVQDGRIVVSGRRGGAIHVANVTEVAAEKVGKVTYDELFLIVREHSGDAVAIGELDEGFAEAEQALRSYLPNFPTDWKPTAEASPIGVRVQVWPTV